MPVEVRFDDDRKVDEIVAKDCNVHLERLNDEVWCLVIETATSRGMFGIHKKGKKVETAIHEVDMNWSPPDNSGPVT